MAIGSDTDPPPEPDRDDPIGADGLTDDERRVEAAALAEAEATLAARAEERIVGDRVRVSRLRFAALVLVVLVLHAAIIAAFLLRDREADLHVAEAEETPVEVIVEPPKAPEQPEAPKPPPPPPPPQPEAKAPPPPPPKEDLSPALSAPRKPNDETTKTEKNDQKTEAPKAAQPPSDGEKQPKPMAAPPQEEAKTETKDDEAAKEEDKSKPDAEALEKAKPKIAKQSKAKKAKASPKRDSRALDALASLSGASPLDHMTFARPSAKTKVYGGTEDVRWMSIVEGMLEAKVGQLPRTEHWQAGGYVVICFNVDPSGRVIVKEWCTRSGYPDIDALAMRALLAAAPFPPPPPGVERGLEWGSKFDGQLPHVTVSRR